MVTEEQKEIQRLQTLNRRLVGLLRYIRGWLNLSDIKRADSAIRIISKIVTEAQDGETGDGKKKNSKNPVKKREKDKQL